jgi:hypothetical protein
LPAPLAPRAALAPVRPLALGKGEPSRAFLDWLKSDVVGAAAPLGVSVPGVLAVGPAAVEPLVVALVEELLDVEPGVVACWPALAARLDEVAPLPVVPPVACAAAVPAAQSKAAQARPLKVLVFMGAPMH